MSKIGRKPISIAEGVKVTAEEAFLRVIGPLGEMKVGLPEGIKVVLKDNKISVEKESDAKEAKTLLGTFVRLLENAISGTSRGFEKTLEVVGTGFRAQMEGEALVLYLGFSHPVKFSPPFDIKLSVQENKIKVFGVNKEKVGTTAYKVKMLKKPDSYKGKGIRFLGEKLRLKPGKAAAKIGGAVGK